MEGSGSQVASGDAGSEAVEEAGGYIKLHRKMLDSVVMSDDWLCRLWVWCLLRANWKDGCFKTVAIPAGSFAMNLRSTAEQLGVTRSKVDRGLQRLEELGQIKRDHARVGQGFTVVSVCHWSTYQHDRCAQWDTSETPLRHQRDTTETPVRQIEERQEEKEPKEGQKNDSVLPLFGANTPAVLVFPTVRGKRNGPEYWSLHQEAIDALSATFPGVDVLAQCRNAHLWVVANPTRRKTASGMPEFLRAWMERCQNRGGRSTPSVVTHQQPRAARSFD